MKIILDKKDTELAYLFNEPIDLIIGKKKHKVFCNLWQSVERILPILDGKNEASEEIEPYFVEINISYIEKLK